MSEHKILLTGRWTARKYLKLAFTQTHYETRYLRNIWHQLRDRGRKVVLALPVRKMKLQNAAGLLLGKVILPEKCLFLGITHPANSRACTQGLVATLILHRALIVGTNRIMYPLNTECAPYKGNL